MDFIKFHTTMLKTTLYSFEQATGKKAIFSIDTFEILELISENSNSFVVKKIADKQEYEISKTSILKLEDLQSESTFVKSSNFKRLSEKITAINQTAISVQSVKNKGFISAQSELNQMPAGYFGTEKHKVPKMSKHFNSSIKVLLIDIENTISEILSRTNKKETIDKVLQLYDYAIEVAESKHSDKIIKLNRILNDKLLPIISRQNGIAGAKIIHARMQDPQNKLKTFLATAAMVAMVLLLAFFYIKNNVSLSTEPEQEQLVVSKEDAFSNSEIESFINSYEIDNDTLLSDWRKLEIKKAFTNKALSYSEAQELVKNIAKQNKFKQ